MHVQRPDVVSISCCFVEMCTNAALFVALRAAKSRGESDVAPGRIVGGTGPHSERQVSPPPKSCAGDETTCMLTF